MLARQGADEAVGCEVDAASSRAEVEGAVMEAVKEGSLVWRLKRAVKEEVVKQRQGEGGLEDGIEKIAADMGALSAVGRRADAVVRLGRARPVVPPELAELGVAVDEEPLDGVRSARKLWEESICEELNSMAAEQGRPLARPRAAGQEVDPGSVRFLYDSEDLLEAVVQVESPNHSCTASKVRPWGLVRVQLRVPTAAELCRKYADLAPRTAQVGTDDLVDESGAFLRARLADGERLLAAPRPEAVLELRRFARRGVPGAQRPHVWAALLDAQVTPQRERYFRMLQRQVRRWDLLLDPLFQLDSEHVTSSDAFFPFTEVLEDTMMAFARDPWVARWSRAAPPQPAFAGTTQGGSSAGAFPPCGVQPFRGLTQYAAPLCYLSDAPEDIYFLFRAMYATLWSRLNIISSARGGLLHVCRLFEELLQSWCAPVFAHLIELGLHPLRLAFPWIHSAFSAYLEMDQVLLLWDRLLAYESVDLLAVLAAAIIAFRADAVLSCADVADVREVFSDASVLRVIPLLQHYLFPSQAAPAPARPPPLNP